MMARRFRVGRTPLRWQLRWGVVALLGSLAASCLSQESVWAQLPSTQLSSIFPPGGKFGMTLDVQVAGADQIDLTQLVFSHPAITATPKVSRPNEFLDERPQPGQYSVTIGGEVPPGIYEARVVGRYGVSNPRAFTVGVHDEVVERGGNTQPGAAVALALDQTISGWVEANSLDYFKLPLKKGQRVLLDCAAQRIDSRMDATLVVHDPAGREVARSRDYAGLDPLIDLTAEADGDYLISLYDFLYRGGNDSFYRLTAHVGPHVDFIFPPAGTAGSNSPYTLYGRNLPGGEPTDLIIDGKALEKLSVSIPLPGDETFTKQLLVDGFVEPRTAMLDAYSYRFNTANSLPIYYARAPVVLEQEPNDEPAKSQTVSVPCELAGQFYPQADVDCVQFEAKQGEVYYLDLIAHRLGPEVDPYLIVQRITRNEQGQESVAHVASVDDPGDRNRRIDGSFDTSTDDPTYRLAVDQDAVYRVIVRDQYGGSARDPRHVYRLTIRKPEPDFRVAAVAERLQVPANPAVVPAGTTSIRRGGTVMYEVRIARQEGFDGEVAVSAEGLPEGVSCSTAYIGPGSDDTVLILRAADNAAFWSGSIRVVAKGTINGQEVSRYARNGIAVWETGNRQLEPPKFRVSSELALAVIDQDPERALVEVGEDKLWETSKGGKLEIPVRVTRREDFKGDLTLAPNNVPNEIKPQNVTIKGDAAEGKLELSITNNNAKPGLYTFYLRADAKIKHVRDPQAITRAEAAQKKLETIVQELTAKQKEAAEGKNAAVKLAEESGNLVKQATEAKTAADQVVLQATDAAKQAEDKLAAAKEAAAQDTANVDLAKAVADAEQAKTDADTKRAEAVEKQKVADAALAEAQAKAKQAEETKVAAEKALADADAVLKRAQEAKSAADKQLDEAKKANNPADKDAAFISTPVRLRIVDTPLKLTAAAPASPLKQGEKVEIPLSIERLYGFDERVEVALELPNNVKGLEIQKVTLAKEQSDGKFEVIANKDATPGEHTVTVRARGKFNNVDVQASQPLVIKIEEVKPAP